MAAKLGFTALLLIILFGFANLLYAFFENKNLHFVRNFLQKIFSKNPVFQVNSFDKFQESFRQELRKTIEISVYFIFFLTIFAQFCLIYSYIISDYSVVNVYQNSHHLKPLIYKISGSWGNHEGSMLLLLTILATYNLAFFLINKSELKITTIGFQSFIIAVFALYTAFASNPFAIDFNFSNQGLGLNPLLQDIGLALHPPVLYLGYIGFFVPFCLAISALIYEKVDENLAKNMELWVFISWGFLTLGIGLGSWWAYRELGWGGYWFWDPVENVSLLPWIASTALIHSVKMLKKKNELQISTILFAIITFTLCLIGIFLVRSGLLTSVHSFAVDAKRGFFIITLITVISGISFLIFALKINNILSQKNFQKNHKKFKFLSKHFSILMNNYFLIIALFTMLLGIFYPIFAREFFDLQISIGANYYNKIFAILLVPFLLFLVISYFEKMQKLSDFLHKKNLIILLFSSILTILFFINSNPQKILETIILFLSFVIIFLIIFNKKSVSNIAHLGFATIIVGIILNSYLGISKEINIKENQEIVVLKDSDLKLKFEEVKYQAGANFISRIAVFQVKKGEKNIKKLYPELRYYPISSQTTIEASIYYGIFGDLYLAIGNKDEFENYPLRIYYKPFIYLIWLGCLLIFGAVFLKIYRLKRIH